MLDYYTILESVRNKSLILEQEFEQVISKFPELFTGKNDASYMEEQIKGNKLMKLANSYDLANEFEGYTLAKDMLENPFIIVNFYMIHAYNNTFVVQLLFRNVTQNHCTSFYNTLLYVVIYM